MSGLFCCCRAGGYSPVCGSPYRHQAHQREAFFIFRGYKKSMGRAVLKTSGYRDLTRPSLCMSTISNRRRNSALGTYIWETIFLPPIPFIWVSRVSPKIWVLLLLPKLRVVSVISWSSCRSATHPPANALLRYREYQQVSTEITQADTKLNFEVCLLFSWLTSLKTEDCTQSYFYSSGLSRWLFPKISVSYVNR